MSTDKKKPGRKRQRASLPEGSSGYILEELRKKAGLSQRRLAKLAGVKQQSISDMETGKTKESYIPTWLALARVLHHSFNILEVEEILTNEGTKSSQDVLSESTSILDLARQAGIPQQFAALFEDEDIKDFTPEQLAKLGRVLARAEDMIRERLERKTGRKKGG